MKHLITALAAAVSFLSAANAATVTYIERARSDAGTPNVNEIPGAQPGFDVTSTLPGGTLGSGDVVNLYLSLTGGKDTVQVDAAVPFDINLDFLDLTNANTVFSIEVIGPGGPFSYTSAVDVITPVTVLSMSAGLYTIIFDNLNNGRRSNFDISIVGQTIPVPMAAPLFLAGIGLASIAFRRRSNAAS